MNPIDRIGEGTFDRELIDLINLVNSCSYFVSILRPTIFFVENSPKFKITLKISPKPLKFSLKLFEIR